VFKKRFFFILMLFTGCCTFAGEGPADGGVENAEVEICAICRQSLDGTQTQTACRHKFHMRCLIPWALQHNNCPTCLSPLWADPLVINYDEDQDVVPVHVPVQQVGLGPMGAVLQHDLQNLRNDIVSSISGRSLSIIPHGVGFVAGGGVGWLSVMVAHQFFPMPFVLPLVAGIGLRISSMRLRSLVDSARASHNNVSLVNNNFLAGHCSVNELRDAHVSDIVQRSKASFYAGLTAASFFIMLNWFFAFL